jgi:hypothetical protein
LKNALKGPTNQNTSNEIKREELLFAIPGVEEEAFVAILFKENPKKVLDMRSPHRSRYLRFRSEDTISNIL